MSLSPDLFLAILAMDSYNRGFDSGIGDGPDGLGESGSIGNANILARPNEIDIADWQAAGFYAVAYQWNGETVISYRGADNPNLLAEGSDFWNGWTLGGRLTRSSARATSAPVGAAA